MGVWRRVPLIDMNGVEDASGLALAPGIVLIDIQGTLLSYAPSDAEVVEARRRLRALQESLPRDVSIALTSNSGGEERGVRDLVAMSPATATASARKPCTRRALRSAGSEIPRLVVGDQPCTDGLLAWKLNVPFGLVPPVAGAIPVWPRLLQFLGAMIRPVFFRETHD